MILTKWSVLREGALVRLALPLPCGHTVLVPPEWLSDGGRFSGRLGCRAPCRRVFDDVVLEGYTAEEAPNAER